MCVAITDEGFIVGNKDTAWFGQSRHFFREHVNSLGKFIGQLFMSTENVDLNTKNEESGGSRLFRSFITFEKEDERNGWLWNHFRMFWSHVVEYLEIGEVIMLSLVNPFIISDHIRIIHPYCLADEWSISRALVNHRSVTVTNETIEKIQHIVNQLIEKNEPLTKFTKRFILNDAELKFDQVVKLLSATRQSSSYKDDIVTFENSPIGFGLEQLEIKSLDDFYTSKICKLLAHCHNLTHLVIDNEEPCVFDGIDDSVSYPVLNSLKYIRFLSGLSDGCGDDDSDISVALKILKLAPNLEYLEFKYDMKTLDGIFMDSLAKMWKVSTLKMVWKTMEITSKMMISLNFYKMNPFGVY